jgi:HSP20 family protein
MPSEVAIQRDNGGAARALARRIANDWDPIRTLRDVLRWDPFSEMLPALQPLEGARFIPDFDVKENKESFVFTADLPGVAEKDLQVQLSGNRLSVSGKRESEKTEQGDTYYTSERSYGSFTRAFSLPEGIDADKVRAELKNGVLSINVPKRPEAQPKKISVASK